MNYFFTFCAILLLIFGVVQLSDMYKRSKYIPQVGDILCRISSKDNPFDRTEIVILAVKDGWVQYSYHPVSSYSTTYSDKLGFIREYFTKIN